MKIKVAWFTTAGEDVGGVAQAIRGLACAARRLEVDPAMVALQEAPFCDVMRRLGFTVQILGVAPPPALEGNIGNKVRLQLRVHRTTALTRPKLVAALRGARFQAIHVLLPNLLPLAAMAASDVGIPCFWEMPNIMGNYPFGINRRMTQHALRKWNVTALANSAYTASTLGDHPVKPIVMYLGADEQRFNPYRINFVTRTQLGIPADAIILGIFARITPAKGQARILEAMAQLPTAYTNTHLLLLGGPIEGDFADELRTSAKSLGIAERLHLIGSVSDPERYYEAIDVAINARIDPEPFGLSVVEAMMMGKPVLVHALGGPAETVLDGQTGWHVHEPTVEGFKAGLLRALGEREKWPAMGAAARQRALEQFSLSRQAKQYVDIVRQRLGNRRCNE